MDKRKQPKSEAWLAAMAARRGIKGTNQFTKARELGLPVPSRSEETRQKIREARTGSKLSEETKQKVSSSMRSYLDRNPDKVGYKLNHYSKGRSYAEEYWKNVLDNNGLEYEEQLKIGLYYLDFAFPKQKIDLEIDGEQHYSDQRIIESDKRRTEALTKLGWQTIRIRWSEYTKLENKEDFVEQLLRQLRL